MHILPSMSKKGILVHPSWLLNSSRLLVHLPLSSEQAQVKVQPIYQFRQGGPHTALCEIAIQPNESWNEPAAVNMLHYVQSVFSAETDHTSFPSIYLVLELLYSSINKAFLFTKFYSTPHFEALNFSETCVACFPSKILYENWAFFNDDWNFFSYCQRFQPKRYFRS